MIGVVDFEYSGRGGREGKSEGIGWLIVFELFNQHGFVVFLNNTIKKKEGRGREQQEKMDEEERGRGERQRIRVFSSWMIVP